jgi:hypothetical protein
MVYNENCKLKFNVLCLDNIKMDLTLFDILLLFIIAISISLVIGGTILYVVDKRLNNIQINIPTCPISTSEKFADISINNNIDDPIKYIIPDSDIEHFTSNCSDNIFQNKNSIGSTKEHYPLLDYEISALKKDILLRQGYSQHQNINSDNNRNLSFDQINKRTNLSHIDKIMNDGVNIINIGIMSPQTNKINDIKHTKIKFHVPEIYMNNDPYISGLDYDDMSLENPSDVDQIGSTPLIDYDMEPIPNISFND